VKTLQDLRELVERLPPGGAVTLPREALLEVLAGLQTSAEYTVAQIADRLHRSPSTVRGWCEAGRFADAFKLNGKDWRVPVVAFEAFVSGQRQQCAPALRAVTRRSEKSRPRGRREATSLGDWSKEAAVTHRNGRP